MSPMSHSDVMDLNAKSSHKKGKKELRSMELERSTNGGIVATHRFKSNGPEYHESETHTFGADEGSKFVAHVQKHFAVKGDKDSSAGAAE
jgi:hypothetical protein